MVKERAKTVKMDFPVEGLWSTFYGMFWKNCCLYFSTTPVAERFFTSSPSLILKHAAWYPSELLDPHIVLLTSDNVIRCGVCVCLYFRAGVAWGAAGRVPGCGVDPCQAAAGARAQRAVRPP